MADTYTLAIIQGQRCRRGFRRLIDDEPASLTGYTFGSQWRVKEARTADLILGLTQYLALDEDDDTLLWLDIPARVTARLDPQAASKDSCWWDLFIWPDGQPDEAWRLVEGPVSMNVETTDTRSAT